LRWSLATRMRHGGGGREGPLRLLLANATTPGVKARFDLLADEVADLDDAPVD